MSTGEVTRMPERAQFEIFLLENQITRNLPTIARCHGGAKKQFATSNRKRRRAKVKNITCPVYTGPM